ncbi:MAG: hypothetical protein K6T75_10935 [Acetobacteraceae bacterium]|nr:hypothetical protein [Acetobacteraceae bacterium]
MIFRISAAAGTGDLERACAQVLRLHAATSERLPFYGEFYRRIFAVTGAPASILDVASGLNPFSLPWMKLKALTAYIACDIDRAQVACVNGFLPLMGLPPPAKLQDVICKPPRDAVQVALVLKALPVLEQQERGCSERLLLGLNAGFLVVSFPLYSLGSRSKGMVRHPL